MSGINLPIRPRRLRRLLALMAFGAILAGTGIGWAVDAHAAPNVCGSLYVSPTVGTVENLGVAYMAEGWTPEQAGELIATIVYTNCPEYAPVLDRFIAAYASDDRGMVA